MTTIWVLLFALSMWTLLGMPQATRAQCFSANDRKASNSTSENVHTLLEGLGDFGLGIYYDLVSDPLGVNKSENVFFSPISIWSALAATYLGSSGNTENQLSDVLGLDALDKNGVANAYRVLRFWYHLRAIDAQSNYTFKMANKLYFDKNENVKDCMERYFSTEIKMVDFAGKPEESRELINRWVSEQTNDKINDMIPPGMVDSTTRLVLVNAAYFKGDWEKQFDARKTVKGRFQAPSGEVTVPIMTLQADNVRYGESRTLGASAVELVYSGGDLSMVVILPFPGKTAEDVVKKLSPATLAELLRNMPFKTIELTMPKFRIEQTLELVELLANAGITDLFNPFLADLSGFIGKKDLSVGNVRHKAFVEVNEQGSEAAAATSLLTVRGGFVPLVVFNVDRPFLFIIRDSVLDTNLFAGLVRNPA